MKKVKSIIAESIAVKQAILADELLLAKVCEVAAVMVGCFKADGKILFCGNGGSAADAQHLSSELSGRFYLDRKALYAEALHVNTSAITAIGNDYDFSEIYARQVEAQGRKGDILFALSTSGNSKNIIKAIQKAKAQNMLVIGLTGESGGEMADLVDHLINIPSSTTPRIQEAHIMVGHILCEIVEVKMFGNNV